MELPFAGHPASGPPGCCAQEGFEVDALRTPAGQDPARAPRRARRLHRAARAEWSPPFELIEFDSPDGGRRAADPASEGFTYDWAWIDEEAGTRPRALLRRPRPASPRTRRRAPPRSSSAPQLGREIEVRQGRGSVIHARPAWHEDASADDLVEFGGIVVLG